jgi:hypothetical protein
MKMKSKIWQDFKIELFNLASLLDGEWDKFNIPTECDEFKIIVSDCEVYPIFTNKDDVMRVEYDLSLCETKLRTISVSTYKGETRVGITLKPQYKSNID